MNKATLKAAGTAALGIALAAAAITPAAADGLGGALGSLPGGSSLPLQALTSQNGGVHEVTGTAQGLVNTTAPAVQNATQTVPVLRAAAPETRGLGGLSSTLGGLPGAAPTGELGGLTGSLPLHSPLG